MNIYIEESVGHATEALALLGRPEDSVLHRFYGTTQERVADDMRRADLSLQAGSLWKRPG